MIHADITLRTWVTSQRWCCSTCVTGARWQTFAVHSASWQETRRLTKCHWTNLLYSAGMDLVCSFTFFLFGMIEIIQHLKLVSKGCMRCRRLIYHTFFRFWPGFYFHPLCYFCTWGQETSSSCAWMQLEVGSSKHRAELTMRMQPTSTWCLRICLSHRTV